MTAQRRTEKLQDVPMTVNAFSAQTLQAFKINTLTDIAALTTGLDLTAAGQLNSNLTLRGVGFTEGSGSFPTVDIYWNDMLLFPTDAFRSLFDMDDVEVLRGPQGAFRGRTSPVGAIIMTTRRPNMSAFEGFVDQQFGEHDLFDSEAALSIPIVADKLAVRIAFNDQFNRGNNGIDLINGQRENHRSIAGRFTAEWRPTDDLDVTLIHQDLVAHDIYPAYLYGTSPYTGLTLTQDQRANLTNGPQNYAARLDLTVWDVKYDLGDKMDLIYTGSWQDNYQSIVQDYPDATNTIPTWNQSSPPDITQWRNLTNEMRLHVATSDFWDWNVGWYYSSIKVRVGTFATYAFGDFPAKPGPPPLTLKVSAPVMPDAESYSFFTSHNFHLTDADLVTLGARWQGENHLETANVIIPAIGLAEQMIPKDKIRLSAYAWTGTVNYTHHFAPDVMAYALYAHGYLPSGQNTSVAEPGFPTDLLTFAAEKSDDEELGLKADFLEHRLRVNADVFHTTYDDFITLTQSDIAYRPLLANGFLGPVSRSVTIGGDGVSANTPATTKGVEAEISAQVTAGWSAMLSGSYIDAEFDNGPLPCNDYLGIGSPNPTPAGLPPRVHGAGAYSICRLHGALSNQSPWSLSLTSEYDFNLPIMGGLGGFVRGLANFKPAYHILNPLPPFTGPVGVAPDFELSLYTGLKDPKGAWEVTLFVKNLTDKQIVTPTSTQPLTAGGVYNTGYFSFQTNPPRQVGVDLRYNL